ncbi:MAG: hypothetical protein HN368_17715, partial [Spirochaetales bacterium]|nr:hypothetical protein [Spirochaetales bacterium]
MSNPQDTDDFCMRTYGLGGKAPTIIVMMKYLLILFLLLASFSGIFAQDAPMAPFVSRLTAQSGVTGVLLMWQDNEDSPGPYYVYGHSKAMTDDNLEEARLIAAVEAGVEQYLDNPTTEGPHYYAVFAGDGAGGFHRVFVPYRNKTTRGLRVTIKDTPEVVIVEITELTGTVSDETITLSFTASAGEEIVIYRSTEPILSQSDLIEAVLIDSIKYTGSDYADKPLPGVPYYYGVFYDEKLRTGQAVFDTSNVLASPVEIMIESVELEAPVNFTS